MFHAPYVLTGDAKTSPPMRMVCSQPARVEAYLLDSTPLAIDGEGNGSLLDRGDQLFACSDGKGHLLLPVKDGAAAFEVVLYSSGAIPEEGLTLDIQVLAEDGWVSYSKNRIDPK